MDGQLKAIIVFFYVFIVWLWVPYKLTTYDCEYSYVFLPWILTQIVLMFAMSVLNKQLIRRYAVKIDRMLRMTIVFWAWLVLSACMYAFIIKFPVIKSAVRYRCITVSQSVLKDSAENKLPDMLKAADSNITEVMVKAEEKKGELNKDKIKFYELPEYGHAIDIEVRCRELPSGNPAVYINHIYEAFCKSYRKLIYTNPAALIVLLTTDDPDNYYDMDLSGAQHYIYNDSVKLTVDIEDSINTYEAELDSIGEKLSYIKDTGISNSWQYVDANDYLGFIDPDGEDYADQLNEIHPYMRKDADLSHVSKYENDIYTKGTKLWVKGTLITARSDYIHELIKSSSHSGYSTIIEKQKEKNKKKNKISSGSGSSSGSSSYVYHSNSSGWDSYDKGYSDVDENGEYDEYRYDWDDEYAAGVDDAMDDNHEWY